MAENNCAVYWYYEGCTRFFLPDMKWIWSRCFEEEKNKNDIYVPQTVSEKNKNDIDYYSIHKHLPCHDFYEFMAKCNKQTQIIEQKVNMNMQSEAELITQEKIKLQQEKKELLNDAGICLTWEKETNNGKSEPLSEYLSSIVETLKINQTYNTKTGQLDDCSPNTNKVGVIYFQKAFYDKKQMQNVDHKFGMNMDNGPKMLFGDDCKEQFKINSSKRQWFGGQSSVMGYWDRKYGFGIPTSFDNSRSVGFVYNDHNFRMLMKQLFKELQIHLLNGGDVIIPYPSKKDLNQRSNKYFKTGGQIIYHNLGISS
eukprot:540736_1